MGRAPCRDKANLKKGAWSREEDTKLKEYIEEHDNGGNWITLPQKADLKRCGKSCRKRWVNYLRPDINRGPFSEEEDNIICRLYSLIGSRWSTIAAQLQGRTDNDIKNHWTARLKKKLLGKSKDHQVDQLAVERPASNEVQSNFTSEAITSPNFYGPQQAQHIDINMDAPYSNLCTGIISQMFEQNCCSRVTESSSSKESVIFPPNPQQVQFDHELSDHNLCLRKVPQNLQGFGVDHHSNNNMIMINTGSPVQAFNCINFSQRQHLNADNQYSSDAANQTSYETSVLSPVLPYATHMDNYIKRGQPSAASVQNVNSQFFPSFPSPEEGNNESAWNMDTLCGEGYNFHEYLQCMNTLDGFNGSTVTESGSSSEADIFPLNPQQVQFDHELSDHNLCLTKLPQNLQGFGADHHSINNINMINTSSPVQASNSIDFSQIQHFIANNQYSSDAAIKTSYETSASPVLPYATYMDNYIKQEQPYAASVQNVNSQFFPSSPSPEEGNNESAWNMDTLFGEGYNFNEYLQLMNTLDAFNGSTVTESGSSSEAAIFPLNPQQVQFDQELCDHNPCLRKLSQSLQGVGADHHSIKNINMINTSSPVQASNCINFSQIQHVNANNQYSSDAAIQASYETSVSPVLPYIRHMHNYIKQEQPSAASVQNVNSQFFPAFPSPEEGIDYESVPWVNTICCGDNLEEYLQWMKGFNGEKVLGPLSGGQ